MPAALNGVKVNQSNKPGMKELRVDEVQEATGISVSLVKQQKV